MIKIQMVNGVNHNDGKKNATGFSFGALRGGDRRLYEQRYGGAGSPGTALAAKQEIVRHIKDEPASLDPIKAVGLPEASWRATCSKGWSIRTPMGK